MKKLFMLIIVATCLAWVGCSEDDTTAATQSIAYEIVSADNYIGVDGGRGVISIQTEAEDLDAVSDSEWLDLSEITPSEIAFNVEGNTSGNKRQANITITVDGVSSKIAIIQAGIEFEIIHLDESVEACGGEGVVSFITPTQAQIDVTSNKEWLTISNSELNENLFTINFEVAPFISSQDRIATISVKTGEFSESYNITQKGAWIEVNTHQVELDPTGKSVSQILFTTNTGLEPTVSFDENCDWLENSVENGVISITPAINYYEFRDTMFEISIEGLEPIRVIAMQNYVDLFPKSLLNAGSAANSDVITMPAAEYMADAVQSWKAVVADEEDSWIKLSYSPTSLTIGVEALNDTWEIRHGVINIVGTVDDEERLLRTIDLYQMDKYALRGCWQFIDKNGNGCEYISLRRQEQIPRGNKTDADFPYILEIHDLKFKSFNNQPWVGITVGDNSEPGVIFSYTMPYVQGWNSSAEFRMVPCNSLPWNEGFQCWGIDTNTGELTMDSKSLGFTFTYAVEEDGTEVLLVEQNAAMKAHPDADKMTGFSWVQFNKKNNVINGPMSGVGIYGNGNIAKLKRTFRPAKDDPRLTVIPGGSVVGASNGISSDRYDDIQWF